MRHHPSTPQPRGGGWGTPLKPPKTATSCKIACTFFTSRSAHLKAAISFKTAVASRRLCVTPNWPDAPFITALLFGPLLLGIFQHLVFEPPARGWHTALKKSPFRPPNFVFPIAWIWSYLSIGYASYIVYRSEIAVIPLLISIPLYLLHVVLLNVWGYYFMKQRRIDRALNIMLALDITASWLLVAVYSIEPFAAALCLPYFCWLLELTYLNIYMERNNPPSHTKEQILAAHETPASIADLDYEDHTKED